MKGGIAMPNGSFAEAQVLEPAGPAAQLFIAGVSLFEITDFEPPVQRATVSVVNLPNPGLFGPYNMYRATLFFEPPDNEPEPITDIELVPTADENVWAGTTLLTFAGTLAPISVTVVPLRQESVGPVIVEGPVFSAAQ
jgi:hypothetical protein